MSRKSNAFINLSKVEGVIKLLSIDYTRLIEAFSLACLLGCTPLGLLFVMDIVLYGIQSKSHYSKIRKFRNKFDDVLNMEWVVVTHYALIIVLTVTLFLHFHSLKGERLVDTFVRLIITPFFVS